jgi:hypothetical protein
LRMLQLQITFTGQLFTFLLNLRNKTTGINSITYCIEGGDRLQYFARQNELAPEENCDFTYDHHFCVGVEAVPSSASERWWRGERNRQAAPSRGVWCETSRS